MISSRNLRTLIAAAVGSVMCVSVSMAQEPPMGMTPQMKAQMAKMSPEQRQMMMSYSPELRQKVMALSPETKQALAKIVANHNRPSNLLTLRQVMQEVLADYLSAATAISVDNAAQAADSARRLANHRIPKGGLLPYFSLEQINDVDLGVLPAMNDAVEGSALRLAEAADKGDMATAAVHLGDIATGCVACHQKFRGQPGVSPLILKPAGATK